MSSLPSTSPARASASLAWSCGGEHGWRSVSKTSMTTKTQHLASFRGCRRSPWAFFCKTRKAGRTALSQAASQSQSPRLRASWGGTSTLGPTQDAMSRADGHGMHKKLGVRWWGPRIQECRPPTWQDDGRAAEVPTSGLCVVPPFKAADPVTSTISIKVGIPHHPSSLCLALPP